MRDVLITTTLVFILVSSLFCVITPIKICKASSTIYVPTDYSNIQEAIYAANSSDTIEVASGTYSENLIINKSITLSGAGKSSTYITGNANDQSTIFINDTENVIITGFTISNEPGKDASHFGIKIFYSSNCEINNNIITETQDGIYLKRSSNNDITSNIIENNNANGISLTTYSDSNEFIENTINNNGLNGIKLIYSSSNIFHDNELISNDVGIDLHQLSNSNIFYDNSFSDNKVNNAFDACSNSWHSGSTGNCWDDYSEEDETYDIPGGSNQDEHPTNCYLQDKPVAQITSIYPNPAEDGDSVHFQGNSISDNPIIGWEWKAGGNIIGNKGSFYYSALSVGTYTISFKVYDGAQWSDPAFRTLVIQSVSSSNTKPSITNMKAMPTETTYGKTVYFFADATDPDDDTIETYKWTSNIDGEIYSGSSNSFSTSSLSVGTHTINLKVKDDQGKWSDTESIGLKINAQQTQNNNPPVADIGGPYSGIVNIPITFDGSNSYDDDDGDNITKYNWYFGDDDTAQGEIVQHAYSHSGQYSVTLVVTDEFGEQSEDAIVVNVENSTDGNATDNGEDNGDDKIIIPGFEIIILIFSVVLIVFIKKKKLF